MTYGSHRAAISSLLELRTQLTVLGLDRGTCLNGKEELHESTAATTITAAAVEQRSHPDRRGEQRATERPRSARRLLIGREVAAPSQGAVSVYPGQFTVNGASEQPF